MSLYLLIPLVACVVSSVLASAILVRDPAHRATQLATAVAAGSAFWAFCEVVWNVQSDPQAALALVRLSVLGWVWIGPVTLNLILEITGQPMPRVRRRLPLLYAAATAFVAVDWLTPWIHPGVVRTEWGWAYRLGPAYPLFYVLTASCVVLSIRTAWRTYATSPSAGDRGQARWLSIGMLIPLVVASLTDGLLPFLGVQLPRLGTASLSALSLTIAWSFYRFGYSLLAPGTFASQILDALPVGVGMVRLDGRVRDGNGALARLLDIDERERLAGFPLLGRLKGLPDDLTCEVTERQCELVTAKRRRIEVSLSTAVVRDKQRDPIGLVLVLRDLDEVVTLRHRLALSGRLAAVGELAAGIAHEINNPLAFVRANVGLLRQHWDTLESELRKRGDVEACGDLLAEGEELIDESLEGVDRAVAIVRDVRGLAHAGGGDRAEADLNALLDGVLRLAGPQLRGRATIEKHYGPPLHVSCAPQELQQVFVNLILNAAQAFDETGTIRLATGSQGGDAVVTIEDDGCGIREELIDRIFDPFFTTKAVGEGTGLGLGIAYEIVRKHGGEIEVESEVGRGTCFRVRLPADPDRMEPDREPDVERGPAPG